MIVFFFGTFLTCSAQVKVVKTAGDKNPTLAFKGVAGNQEFSSLVIKDLKRCGWFDVVSGPTADYVVSGTGNGSAVQINVTGNSSFTFNVPIPLRELRKASAKAVDAMLRKLFGVSGICSSKIAFCAEVKRGIKEIYVCDYDGGNPTRITKNMNLSVEPDWAPDDNSLIYTMYSKGYTDIVQYDLLSNRCRRVAQFPGLNAGGTISPNGKYLALILSKDGRIDLYVKLLAGKAMRRLTKGDAVEASPCWSPNGGRLCFVSDYSGGRPTLFTIGANGGAMKKLPTLGGEAVSPDWSCGNEIVYAAKMGRNYAVAVLDLNGKKEAKVVVNAAGDWECPSWAPDGRHVVCSRTQSGKSDLYIIDTWLGKTTLLLSGKYNFSMPSWSGLR